MTTSDPFTNQTLPWPVSNALRQYREQSRNLKKVACRNVAQAILQRLYRAAIPESSRYREMLLLEATQKGLVPLAMELLQGQQTKQEDDSPIDDAMDTVVGAVDLPPVSFFIKDKKDNSLLHLAVLSGRPKMVSALQKFLRDKQANDMYKEFDCALNQDAETPFSLAIRKGNMRVLFAIVKGSSYFNMKTISNLEEDIQKLNIDTISYEAIQRGDYTLKELRQRIFQVVQQQSEGRPYALVLSPLPALAILDARMTAHGIVKDAVDVLGRKCHLQAFRPRSLSLRRSEKITVEAMREEFSGVAHPWWDTTLSNFDRERYLSHQTDQDRMVFFNMLLDAADDGNMPLVLYLLREWKTPVSLTATKGESPDFCGVFYTRRASKVLEHGLIGWTREKAVEILRAKNETDEADETMWNVSSIFHRILGTEKIYQSWKSLSSVDRYLWHVSAVDRQDFVSQDVWNELYSSVSDERKSGRITKDDTWFDISPLSFTAIKLAYSTHADDFESSGHALVLRYFFDTIYPSNPDLSPADLPSLAKFLALDYLPFLQFLTKERENGASYLSLDTPLLGPASQPLDETDDGTEEEEEEDFDKQCVICYEACENPFPLNCGHRFHRHCLLASVFGAAQNESGHQFLSRHPHLSFTIGNSPCPYCRQYLRPSLQDALAFNLADGIQRTFEEKTNRPLAPHLDLAKCPPHVTIGEVLLAFSACCGAIGIFQHLVVDCGIEPDQVHVGGVNVMHHAVAHNQILIIRWLLKKGYSSLLYGRMSREAFDSFVPSLGPDAMMEEESIDLGDNVVSERLSFWKEENERRRGLHIYFDDDKYSEKELEFLEEGLSDGEGCLLKLHQKIELQSPLHCLLTSSVWEQHNHHNRFHRLLSSMGLPTSPANWCDLILKFCWDSTKRSDALCNVSQKVLSVPDQFRGQQLIFPPADPTKVSSLRDVLHGLSDSEVLSPLSISKDVLRFNFWKMLRSGAQWTQFFRVAKSLNVWHILPYYDFVPSPSEHIWDDRTALVQEVINQGRTDVLVAFCSMGSFCGDSFPSSVFSLFDDRSQLPFFDENLIPLRPMIEQSQCSHAFSTFLAHVDDVKQTSDTYSLSFSFHEKIASLIRSGETVEAIMQEANKLKEGWLRLAGNRPPLGVGTRDEIEEATEYTGIDWMQGRSYGDKRDERLLDAVVKQKSGSLMEFLITNAFQRSMNIDEDASDYLGFLRKNKTRLVDCCDPIFAIAEFVRFGVEKQGYDQQDLMRGLLFQEHADNDDGILDDCFSSMFIYIEMYMGEREEATETMLKVEKIYEVVQWFMDQPETVPILSNSPQLFLGSSLRRHSINSPQEVFRILKLMQSHSLDIQGNNFDGQNLVQLLYKWEDSCWRIKGNRKYSQSTNDYKDASGRVITTMPQVVEWLALEVGVDIQHLSHADLTRDIYWRQSGIMTETEFEELKARQLSKMSRMDSEQYHTCVDDDMGSDMEVDDFHSCSSDA